jgi:hypothetical protein
VRISPAFPVDQELYDGQSKYYDCDGTSPELGVKIYRHQEAFDRRVDKCHGNQVEGRQHYCDIQQECTAAIAIALYVMRRAQHI